MDIETTITSRSTTDIIGLLGTFGGTWDFLTTLARLFLSSFAAMNYASLIANRFYTWNAPKSFTEDGQCFSSLFANEINYDTEQDQKKRQEIPIPPFLAFWQFYYSYICCFCKGARYRDYQETIKIVE